MALTETALIEGHDYTFKQLRQLLRIVGGMQEGVFDPGDYLVTAGAGMTVNVAAGDALVQMDSGVGNGLYLQSNDAAINGVVVPAAHGSLARLDQIVLQIRDPNVAGAFDTPQLYVLQGVPTAGATLDNRNGFAALPNDHLLLFDHLTPAGSSSVSAGNLRDRRKRARGAFTRIARAVSNYTTASVTPTLVDGVNLQPRIEVASAANTLRVTLRSTMQNNTAGASVDLELGIAGVAQNLREQHGGVGYAAGMSLPVNFIREVLIAPQSALVGPMWLVSSGTATLFSAGTYTLELTVEEIIRPNN